MYTILVSRTRHITIILSLLLFCVFFASPYNAVAAIYNVGSAAELQSALTNAASNNEDDVINISAGRHIASQELTYSAAVNENFAITLAGAGAAQTIIDGSGFSTVAKMLKIDAGYTAANADIHFKDLSIERGLDGSYLRTKGNVSIENCIFNTNASMSAAVLYIDAREASDPDITISNSRFEYNNAQGAALITITAGRVQVDHSAFNNNFLTNYTTISSGLNISVLKLNTVAPPDIKVFNNQFSENHGARGGGLAIYVASEIYPAISVSNNQFSNNYASFHGGGVYALLTDTGNIAVSANHFQRNFAEGAGAIGGAVDIIAATPLDNTNSVIVEKNIFINNSASDISAVGGGAVSLEISGGTANMNNNFVMSNHSTHGGGVFINAMRGATANIINNSFSGNDASSQLGHTLYSRLSNEDTTLNIYNNVAWDPAGNPDNQIYISDDFEKNQLGATVNLFNNDYGTFTIDIGDALTMADNIINQNPLFVTDVTHWDLSAWDLHLQLNSPIKDLGNIAAPGLPLKDIDEQDRVLDAIVDIGADELLLGVPNIQLNTTNIDAGSVSLGSNSGEKSLVFYNRGSATLTIDSVVLSGVNADEFSLLVSGGTTPCQVTPIILSANGSCTMSVIFSPITAGTKTAVVDIHSDDLSSPSTSVSLMGIAYLPSGKPNDSDMSGDSGDGGACFIATAAYGSYLQHDVKFLRQFRDRVLLPTKAGREFVSFYYRHSPDVANIIAKSDFLRAATRVALTPLVETLKLPLSQSLMN